MSININQIVTADYGNIVAKANPTGLLPTWNKWIDKAQAAKLGFKYNVAGAKALLAANGYKDTNGDGYVENKDGQSINLRLIVPNGWSDWMTAIQIIAASAKDAGIKITPAYPDYNGLVDERNSGKFDLVINNDKQLGPTPYTYYDYLFHLPIADSQTFANYARFTAAGPKPWALTLALNKVPPTNVAKAKAIHSKIQKYILEDLPAIPLWYNGMWSQYNTTYWTNFPKSTGAGMQNTNVVWNGYLNMTSIDALAKLKPAEVATTRRLSDRYGLVPPPGRQPPRLCRHRCRQHHRRRDRPHRRDPLPRPQDPPLPADVLRRGDDRLGDPAPDAGRPGRRADQQAAGRLDRLAGAPRATSPSRSGSTSRSGSSTSTSGAGSSTATSGRASPTSARRSASSSGRRCRTRSRCSSPRSCSATSPATASARWPRGARCSTTPRCPVAYVLTATPYMWLALVLVYFLAFKLGALPRLGRLRLLDAARPGRGSSPGASSATGSCRS